MSQATLRFDDQNAGKVMSPLWAAMVLVLAAVITGVLGFGLMHLIEHAI
jgi:hypothetical protein